MVGKLMMANEDYIPLEIQEEIMKRLPAKSLIRFSLVSKSWKSLIHSSKFIADHCVQKHRLLVETNHTEDKKPKWVSIADDDTFPQQKCDLTFPINSSIKLVSEALAACYAFYTKIWLFFGILPRKSICFTRHQLYIDGRIYWAAYDDIRFPDGSLKRSKLIVSFATTSEKFTEISLPNSLALAKTGIHLGISKLRKSLIVVEDNRSDQVIGIWMMKNHCDPTSFTKLFNINLADAAVTRVFGFRNSGEAIMKIRNDDNDALYVYEPSLKHFTFTGISHPCGFLSYTETLLLLNH